jgi:hypothetical protein
VKDREHTFRILTHNEVYFAKCTDFNDPFDCRLHISVEADFATHKAQLRKLHPGLSEAELYVRTHEDLHPTNIKRREHEVNAHTRRMNENIGIFSMSAKRDNLLMWSHYADCHRGICIEFKTTEGALFGCDLLDVYYDGNYPRLNVCDDVDFEFVKRCLRTKSADWDYEKEWRIIYKEVGCQSFRPEDSELTGVILGAHISTADKGLVRECLARSSLAVQLYEARECKDRFASDIIPIE